CIAGAHEHNTPSSCAFPPTCCLSVPRTFLTAPQAPPFLASPPPKWGCVCTPENSQPVTIERGNLGLRALIAPLRRLEDGLTVGILGGPHLHGHAQGQQQFPELGARR